MCKEIKKAVAEARGLGLDSLVEIEKVQVQELTLEEIIQELVDGKTILFDRKGGKNHSLKNDKSIGLPFLADYLIGNISNVRIKKEWYEDLENNPVLVIGEEGQVFYALELIGGKYMKVSGISETIYMDGFRPLTRQEALKYIAE